MGNERLGAKRLIEEIKDLNTIADRRTAEVSGVGLSAILLS